MGAEHHAVVFGFAISAAGLATLAGLLTYYFRRKSDQPKRRKPKPPTKSDT